MAEVVGLVASAVEIAQLTWVSCKTLNDTIKRYRNAPERLRNLLGDLDVLLQLLQPLRGHHKSSISAGQRNALEALNPAIQGCQQLCDDFTKRLSELTSHSREDYIGKRDRIRFHFNDTEVMLLKERLLQYKLTFDIALNVASLKTTNQNKQMTEHLETNLVTSMGSLSGQVESLETVMQSRQTQKTSVANQDQTDVKARRAVTTLGQYARVLKQCLKTPTPAPALKGTSKRKGATSTWIRALDDAKQVAGNVGDVGCGGPAVYVGQAEAKDKSREYFGSTSSGDIAVNLSRYSDPRYSLSQDTNSAVLSVTDRRCLRVVVC